MRNGQIGIKLNYALGSLDSLPAMPDIAHKLLALPLDTEAGEAQMIFLIEQDPQLSAKLIGLANTPMLGVRRKIISIHDAAMLLGLKRMKSVAIGIATMTVFENQPATRNFDPQYLWLHSITVAIVMNTLSQAMPKHLQPDENQLFLSGLLHDIGLMALHHLNPELSEELHHQLQLQPKRPITEIELELLGTTHGHIGAYLARHWNLPEEISKVIESHHPPFMDSGILSNLPARLANLAEKLLPNFGIAEHTVETIDENDWRALSIEPVRAGEISAMANELAIQIVQMPDKHQSHKHTENRVHSSASAAPLPICRTFFSNIFTPTKVMSQWIRFIWR